MLRTEGIYDIMIGARGESGFPENLHAENGVIVEMALSWSGHRTRIESFPRCQARLTITPDQGCAT